MLGSDNFTTRCIGVVLLLTLLYQLCLRLLRSWRFRSFGQPPVLPKAWWDVLGVSAVMGLQSALNDNTVLEHLQSLLATTRAACGYSTKTYIINMLGQQTISTVDPKNIQAMLATQFADFGLGIDRSRAVAPFLGVGIFSTDGELWEHSRAILKPSFSKDRVANLSLEERHCQHLLAALPPIAQDGWTPEFDIQPFFYKLTMDATTEFFFGQATGSLTTKDDVLGAEFVEAFDRGISYVCRRAVMGPFCWLLNSHEFRRDCRIVHQWTDQCVQRGLDEHRWKKSNNGHAAEYIFLEELIEQTQDPVELRSHLLHVLAAGRDTTASLLSFVFYCLCRRPDLYAELRNVVLDTFGTYEEPQNISYASLKACKPLQNVLRETLRLHPGVPLNGRYALKDTTLPCGAGPAGNLPCSVPKGTQIFYNISIMHRDPDIWGLNADEFVPERWNGLKLGWEYLPFNGGPRVCLGQNLSLTSAAYCVVRMLQQFDGLRTSDERPLRVHASLTASCANGVYVSLHTA